MNAQKLEERTGATPGSIAQSIVNLGERLVLLGHDISAGLNLVAESTQARIAMLDTDLMACGKAYHDLAVQYGAVSQPSHNRRVGDIINDSAQPREG